MRDLLLDVARDEQLSFLFIGAHCDDIEIGCGGAISRLVERFPDATYTWVVLCSDASRAAEARAGAAASLATVADTSVVIREFRDGFLPYVGGEVKDSFEELKRSVSPDLIFTHNRSDAHQDHRLARELTWNTFRDHLILEYETPKYDGDLGTPNVFVELSPAQCDQKVDLLLSSFPSQHSHGWFTPETFRGLMRLRGIQCNAPGGYAEAFYSEKARLAI
jgi:LmbE family N-acetylglucosaminyl deacetylase